MRHLLRLSAALLSLGMVGAAACSSCSQSSKDGNDPNLGTTSYVCGANTHLEGSQCVPNRN